MPALSSSATTADTKTASLVRISSCIDLVLLPSPAPRVCWQGRERQCRLCCSGDRYFFPASVTCPLDPRQFAVIRQSSALAALAQHSYARVLSACGDEFWPLSFHLKIRTWLQSIVCPNWWHRIWSASTRQYWRAPAPKSP